MSCCKGLRAVLKSPVLQPVASSLLSPHRLIVFFFFLLLRDGIPGSQSVTEEFALEWPQVLSSAHGVALAWVDGRSGVGRGQKTSTDSRKLGSLRVKDYLGVVESVMQPHKAILLKRENKGYQRN